MSCPIGFSDHTNDIKTSIYSNLLGAKIIEKHFYLGKGHDCVDKAVSINPFQMKTLKSELSNIENILGKVKYGIRKEEINALQFKRVKMEIININKLRKYNYLVTGGTGSFGQKLVKILQKKVKPKRIVVFSRDELN